MHHQNQSQIYGPKTIVLQRKDGHGFGFTLRHFIVYPPDSCTGSALPDHLALAGILNLTQPMDTVFVKEVRPYGPAHSAGLQTGDRLLSVNGMPVAGTPYNRVVAAIQQAPTTLTLQVVPKQCDILQTFFSETAHNPETNQRPKQYPSVALTPKEIGNNTVKLGLSSNTQLKDLTAASVQQQHPKQILIPIKKESPYGGPSKAANSEIIYAEPYNLYRSIPLEPQPLGLDYRRRAADRGSVTDETNKTHHTMAGISSTNGQLRHVTAPRTSLLAYDPHLMHLSPIDRRESSASAGSSIGSYDSGSTLTSDLDNSAIMTRLRKSFEQKEEFLRRGLPHSVPVSTDATTSATQSSSQLQTIPPMSASQWSSGSSSNDKSNVVQREFYARPNRLQKPIWPPPEFDVLKHPMNAKETVNNKNKLSGSSEDVSTKKLQNEQQSEQEQITISADSLPLQPKTMNTLPPHRLANHLAREKFYNGTREIVVMPEQHTPEQEKTESIQSDETSSTQKPMETEENRMILPTQGLQIVSERTKLFESGRPLSPDGSSIDRTSLYRSELCRLNTKRPVPNVAYRRKEFELKAETNDWRRLSDENDRSSESSDFYHHSDRTRSLSADSTRNIDHDKIDKYHNYYENDSRHKASRQYSYLEAVKQAGGSVDADSAMLFNDFNSNFELNNHSAITMKELKMAHRNQTILTGGLMAHYDCDNESFPFDFTQFADDEQSTKTFESMEIEHNYQRSSRAAGIGTNFKIDLDNVSSRSAFIDKDTEMKPIQIMPRNSITVPVRPTTLYLTDTAVVLRRQKSAVIDDDRPMRRVSYLRATANENSLQGDSDMDNSPTSGAADTPESESASVSNMLKSSGGSKTKALSYLRDTPADPSTPVTLEGELHLKITFIDGKRSPDRSWRLVSAEVRGNKLKMTLHREGKSNQSPEPSGIIDLRSFHVTEGNYTKRKHVFKLSSAPLPVSSISSTSATNVTSPSLLPQSSSTSAIVAGTELLIQADSHQDMKVWMDTLRKASCMESASSVEYLPKFSTQTNETQHLSVTQAQQSSSSSGEIPSSKSVRKYLGTRSPSGQSPVTKSRKTPQLPNITIGSKDSSDKEVGSPKSRTWKGLVARQFRKMQGQPPTSPNPSFGQLPEGISIGVPLTQCIPSEDNEYVPLIVARCTQIVESRGLGVVGIYRIPGNTAAITALTEQVNRGFDEQTLSDPRWEDVNVVSSLLKLFIRSLPDGLLPNDLYNSFIEADKETGQERLSELNSLLGRLPPHCYETLKHLMRHLNLVSRNCDTNLMEPKNLAIIFGPSVVRTSNETLETVVKDMKHQCRIVELLVSHYDYFFENGQMPVITDTPDYSSVSPPEMQTNLLLDNVSKIEPIKEQRESARFVSKFVQAASRKTRKNTYRKSIISTLTPDTISLDSSTSAESKEHQKLSHKFHRSSGNEDVLRSRLSEDESHDGAFTDNGSMSLTTVTIALDDKLRSLRNSTFEQDDKIDSISEPDANDNTNVVSLNSKATTSSSSSSSSSTTTNIKNQIIDRLQPLTLGDENIPYADESPERPLIQSVRTKPLRVQTYSIPSTTRYPATRLYSQSSTSPNTSPTDVLSSSQSHSSQENVAVNCPVPVIKAPSSVSSDDTDTSTTSNPLEKCSSTIRIDREMLREMNRILTTLERKATKLNRSLSLNYKYNKGECCCNGNNNNNSTNNNNYRSISNNRFSLTKDEKTDKNINKKRQIQDIKNRRYANRSIKRRHTVGGTHDYGSTKTTAGEQRCQQEGHIIARNGQMSDIGTDDVYIISTRTSSPDLTKDNQTLGDSKRKEN